MKLSFKIIGIVFLGGALGSLARYGVGLAVDDPWPLLIVNSIGTLLLGFTNGRKRSDANQAFWGAGVAGGFTTMSGLSLLVALTNLGVWAGTLAFVFASLSVGFAAYLIGLKLAGVGK